MLGLLLTCVCMQNWWPLHVLLEGGPERVPHHGSSGTQVWEALPLQVLLRHTRGELRPPFLSNDSSHSRDGGARVCPWCMLLLLIILLLLVLIILLLVLIILLLLVLIILLLLLLLLLHPPPPPSSSSSHVTVGPICFLPGLEPGRRRVELP
jgi:hypothetical protein